VQTGEREAWPSGSQLERETGRATLVLACHPQCPCTRATMDELNKLLVRCQGKLKVHALFYKPRGAAEKWAHTGLWQTAAELPDVTVHSDDGAREARRFGMNTSGQVQLFAADGRLLFSGGITAARGHSGDNRGSSLIRTLVLDPSNAPAQSVATTPVFGCGLDATEGGG
jgi:hypothetical protein